MLKTLEIEPIQAQTEHASAPLPALGGAEAFPAELADEAIYILRETAAQFEKPAILFSGGKDSIVVTHLAVRAFAPGKVPFPLLHVDTGHNFIETIDYRDWMVKTLGLGFGGALCARQHRQRPRARGDRQIRQPQRAANSHASRRNRRAEIRCLHRRGAARRRKGAGQRAHLQRAQRVRPVGCPTPTARVIRHAEWPH